MKELNYKVSLFSLSLSLQKEPQCQFSSVQYSLVVDVSIFFEIYASLPELASSNFFISLLLPRCIHIQ